MVIPSHTNRRRAEAQAAAWVARLQSETRDDVTEAALRSWLEADEEHKAAFERATEVWGMIPGAAQVSPARDSKRSADRRARVPHLHANVWLDWRLALAASLLLFVGVAGGWWLMDRPAHYATARGEQEIATFDDGSRVSLNTDTALSVRYREGVREVRLDHGEAMFEVAPDQNRPFIVDAGVKRVRALGTSFIVRRTGNEVAIVLIEGRVAVDHGGARASRVRQAPVILTPGERLTYASAGASAIDRPSLEAATAWRRGQAMFDDVPLVEAVAEVNRYGGPGIVIDDPRVASLRVSGVFATNDTAEFALAVATLHDLRLERRGQHIHLAR
jgi:transmembrane sensor